MVIRPVLIAAAALLGLAGQSRAQSEQQSKAAPAGNTCVQVEIAGQTASALNCLNQELQDQALAASGHALPVVPLGAGSPTNAVGVFNQFGVAEQYGKNFGISVMPYRPPPPVFGGGVH